jgi:hypothetical protein
VGSWRPLLLWTLLLFGPRLTLAFSDGSILCGPDSTWDKGVTAPSRAALWLVRLAALLLDELLRNPCLRPF